MFKKVHHIAIAVYDLEKKIQLLKTIYGVMVDRKIVITDRKMNTALIKIGEIWLEYLAPISGDSPLNAFLEKKGEDFHHIAY